MESTWLSREVPILEAVAAAEGEGVDDLDMIELGRRVALSPGQLAAGLDALVDGAFLAGRDLGTRTAGGQRTVFYSDVRLRERGRRVVGTWPPEEGGVEALLALIGERIEATPDEEEKSKLTKLRDGVQSVGKDVGTALLTAWVKSVAGLP